MLPPAVALTWPKNLAHATSPHEAQIARFGQSAAGVVALSATGVALTADLVVTEGHKHGEHDTVIRWRQLGQWALSSQVITTQSVGYPVDSVTPRSVADLPFRVALSPLGTSAPYRVLYPRVRASVPAPGAPAGTVVTLTGDLVRLPGGAPVVVATLPTLRIVTQLGPPLVAYTNTWFAFGPIEVAQADLVAASGRLALRLAASIGGVGQSALLLEAQVGLLSGL